MMMFRLLSGPPSRRLALQSPHSYHSPYAVFAQHRQTSFNYTPIEIGRRNRIRTCDPLVPNQMLYQTELISESNT